MHHEGAGLFEHAAFFNKKPPAVLATRPAETTSNRMNPTIQGLADLKQAVSQVQASGLTLTVNLPPKVAGELQTYMEATPGMSLEAGLVHCAAGWLRATENSEGTLVDREMIELEAVEIAALDPIQPNHTVYRAA